MSVLVRLTLLCGLLALAGCITGPRPAPLTPLAGSSNDGGGGNDGAGGMGGM